MLSLVLGLVCNANHKKWKKLGGPACQAGFQTHACAAVTAGLDSPSASEAGARSHKPEPGSDTGEKGWHPARGADTEVMVRGTGQPSQAPL